MSMERRTAVMGAVVQTVTVKRIAAWDIVEVLFMIVSCET